jgi:hypothetical protein
VVVEEEEKTEEGERGRGRLREPRRLKSRGAVWKARAGRALAYCVGGVGEWVMREEVVTY